jgi:hypothetical protein
MNFKTKNPVSHPKKNSVRASNISPENSTGHLRSLLNPPEINDWKALFRIIVPDKYVREKLKFIDLFLLLDKPSAYFRLGAHKKPTRPKTTKLLSPARD